MKDEKRVALHTLCERLQSRMNYLHPEFAFDVLLYGWCKQRHHRVNWLSDVRRRGWLSMAMARDFADYCGYMIV